MAQPGSAPEWGSGGRGFKSRRPDSPRPKRPGLCRVGGLFSVVASPAARDSPVKSPVYLGAPPNSAIHGVQTYSVPAGGGMIFEMQANEPGEYVFVHRSFGHGQKGAIGTLVVDE